MEHIKIDFSGGIISFKTKTDYYSPHAGVTALLLLKIGKEGVCTKKTTLKPKTEEWLVPQEVIDVIKLGANDTTSFKLERMLAGILSKEETAAEVALVNKGLKYIAAIKSMRSVEFNIKKIHVKLTPVPTKKDPERGSLLTTMVTLSRDTLTFSYMASFLQAEMIGIAKSYWANFWVSLQRASVIATNDQIFGTADARTIAKLIKTKNFTKHPLTNEIKQGIIQCLQKGVPLSAVIALN